MILNSVSQNRHGRRRTAERFMKQGNKEERQPFFKFIDRKSYLLMAVMMGGGIALRAGGLAPLGSSRCFTQGSVRRSRRLESCSA